MVLNREGVTRLYDRMARIYDLALLPYRLAGVTRRRRALVARLGLRRGDTVADLGCGTGANLAFLVEAVGPEGRVVGVDLSAGMLARARRLAADNGWNNVDLVEADLRDAPISPETAAVISTFALEMVPEYDAVVARLAAELAPGARLGLLGLKRPERWPDWLVAAAIWVNRPFGVTREYEEITPWVGVERHMRVESFREYYLGAVYECIGTVPSRK